MRLTTEERINALLWDPKSGPPPGGVGILQLLDQKRWWIPQGNPPIRVKHMDDRYRRNVVRFLERRADYLKLREEIRLITGPQPSGDMACDAFDSVCHVLFEQSALDWLRQKPLHRRMRKGLE